MIKAMKITMGIIFGFFAAWFILGLLGVVIYATLAISSRELLPF